MATNSVELRGAEKKEAFFRAAEEGVHKFAFAVPDVEVVAVGWWELRNEDFTRFRNIRRGPRIVGQCLKNCQRLAL